MLRAAHWAGGRARVVVPTPVPIHACAPTATTSGAALIGPDHGEFCRAPAPHQTVLMLKGRASPPGKVKRRTRVSHATPNVARTAPWASFSRRWTQGLPTQRRQTSAPGFDAWSAMDSERTYPSAQVAHMCEWALTLPVARCLADQGRGR